MLLVMVVWLPYRLKERNLDVLSILWALPVCLGIRRFELQWIFYLVTGIAVILTAIFAVSEHPCIYLLIILWFMGNIPGVVLRGTGSDESVYWRLQFLTHSMFLVLWEKIYWYDDLDCIREAYFGTEVLSAWEFQFRLLLRTYCGVDLIECGQRPHHYKINWYFWSFIFLWHNKF